MVKIRSDERCLNIYSNYHIDFVSRRANPCQNETRYDGFIHQHNTGEFVFILKGASTVIVDQSIAKGQGSFLIYYPPMSTHQQINDPNVEYVRYAMSVDRSYFEGEVELPAKWFLLELSNEETESMLAPVELLYRYFSHCPKEYTRIMTERRDYLLRLFLAETRALLDKDNVKLNPVDNYIGQVCLYINSHIGESPTLSELAERFFVCRAKLTRDFRAELGMSVGDYIASSRIGKAKYLLHGESSIADIAVECGWSSAAHFVRAFKRVVGMTPAKYRAERIVKENMGLTIRA